jgi:uncharacterized protein involved in oxidation of intracellular sulfur
MLSAPIKRGAAVGVCGTCMDARDIGQVIEGAHRGTLDELTDWILWADKVVAY